MTLARKSRSGLFRKVISPNEAHAIELIVAMCGLIHDLENPPFGQAGERAISYWFKQRLYENKQFFDFGMSGSGAVIVRPGLFAF